MGGAHRNENLGKGRKRTYSEHEEMKSDKDPINKKEMKELSFRIKRINKSI